MTKYKVAIGGIGGLILGLLGLAVSIAEKFPEPWSYILLLIVFVSAILIVADIASGGLLD
jgi:hypothetical protein